MHLAFLTAGEGFVIKQLGIRVIAACILLCAFPGVAADSAQTSAPGSGSLEALLQSALNEHPLVDAGKAEIRSAQQGVKSARWQFFPTPGVEYQRAFADDADGTFQGDDYSTVISLEQPLWSGGRISGGVASARAALGVSQASLQENQRELALRVVQAYGEWLTASLQKDTLEASELRHLNLFERVRRRMEGGVSTGSDLQLASGRLQSVKSERAAIEARERSAIAVLSKLSGRSLTVSIMGKARRNLPQELVLLEASLVDRALSHSPSIERADAQVESARAEIKTRRAQTRPNVFLRFERQFNNLQFANQGPDSRVLVGVRSQFGAGLSSYSGIAEARETVSAALAFRRSAELSIREQVRTDLALLKSFEIRLPALHEATRTAIEVYESYQRQFLTGRKSWLDVMNSARDLQQARLQLADVTAGHLTLSWRLYVLANPLQAIGG